jgi:hypothetical protein
MIGRQKQRQEREPKLQQQLQQQPRPDTVARAGLNPKVGMEGA